jgi:hypothetical protein
MADIRPFRRARRLQSLDECSGPRLRFNPIPPQSISMFVLAPVAMLIGVLLGYLLFF